MILFAWNDSVYKADFLAGAWDFVAEVDSATYRPYVGMRLYFEVFLVQEETR